MLLFMIWQREMRLFILLCQIAVSQSVIYFVFTFDSDPATSIRKGRFPDALSNYSCSICTRVGGNLSVGFPLRLFPPSPLPPYGGETISAALYWYIYFISAKSMVKGPPVQLSGAFYLRPAWYMFLRVSFWLSLVLQFFRCLSYPISPFDVSPIRFGGRTEMYAAQSTHSKVGKNGGGASGFLAGVGFLVPG